MIREWIGPNGVHMAGDRGDGVWNLSTSGKKSSGAEYESDQEYASLSARLLQNLMYDIQGENAELYEKPTLRLWRRQMLTALEGPRYLGRVRDSFIYTSYLINIDQRGQYGPRQIDESFTYLYSHLEMVIRAVVEYCWNQVITEISVELVSDDKAINYLSRLQIMLLLRPLTQEMRWYVVRQVREKFDIPEFLELVAKDSVSEVLLGHVVGYIRTNLIMHLQNQKFLVTPQMAKKILVFLTQHDFQLEEVSSWELGYEYQPYEPAEVLIKLVETIDARLNAFDREG